MRLFVAVPIAEDIRLALAKVQTKLVPIAQQAGVRVKWVEQENFHLTVAFLGELSESALSDVTDACAAVAGETGAFRVRVAGMSVFPKPRSASSPEVKTIWAGLSEGYSEWRKLIERAEPWFVPFGAARDGGLHPHITLGRVKTERAKPMGDHAALRTALQAESATEFGAMQADSLTLIESTLDPRGALYREIGRWQFDRKSETENATEDNYGNR